MDRMMVVSQYGAWLLPFDMQSVKKGPTFLCLAQKQLLFIEPNMHIVMYKGATHMFICGIISIHTYLVLEKFQYNESTLFIETIVVTNIETNL